MVQCQFSIRRHSDSQVGIRSVSVISQHVLQSMDDLLAD